MRKVCTWSNGGNGYNWDSECGSTYFPYIKDFEQPSIVEDEDGDDICPWCGRKIKYKECSDDDTWEEDEDDYEDGEEDEDDELMEADSF